MNKAIVLSIIGIVIVAVSVVLVLSFQTDYTNFNLNYRDLVFEQSNISLDKNNPIKMGILHSLSGTMTISESVVVGITLGN